MSDDPINGAGPPRDTGGPTNTTSDHHSADRQIIGDRLANRQVSWWGVHDYVTRLQAGITSWPMVGTQAWCVLADDDPVKLAAIYDAAQHWALRIETCQVAKCEASHDVSAAADWKALGTSWLRHHNATANPAHIPRAVA